MPSPPPQPPSLPTQEPPAFVSSAPTLTQEDVERFGRQMLVEEMGAAHMAQIRQAHVVCVGAGGLGSTILLYLAATGVGRLTIVDHDDVELSNLHRQTIHTTASLGRPKAESAKEACLRLYPGADVVALTAALTPSNAESLFRDCDVVVDGTDNVASRYIINDAAMRCRKPLVSGSAMGWDGQLSVYGYRGGPCYRCLFPLPPPPASVGSCNDSGVMGPLPGMIGCLQALETLKVITGVGETLHGRLFLFNGLRLTSRVVTLRGRQPQCSACSSAALEDTTPLASLAGSTRPEYVPVSCASDAAPAGSLAASASCSVDEFAEVRGGASPCVVLDVRVRLQYDMAHLPKSICVPYQQLQQWQRAGTLVARLGDALAAAAATDAGASSSAPARLPVFVLCRRGINSVKAVQLILEALQGDTDGSSTSAAGTLKEAYEFRSVTGGLNAYHLKVDKRFPYY